jgi:hypothetical protein
MFSLKQMDGEAIVRISFFLGIFGFLALWELVAPRRPLATSKRVRWPVAERAAQWLRVLLSVNRIPCPRIPEYWLWPPQRFCPDTKVP